MRGLSSIMRSRWMRRSTSVAMTTLRVSERQRQREGGTLSRAGAARIERATELARCERAAVEPKAVAIDAGREPVIEDALEILRRDADTGIDDRDGDGGGGRTDAHRHAFVPAGHLGAGVLGIADHVHQDL